MMMTLQGKYFIDQNGINNITVTSDNNSDYSGPPTIFKINYTDMKGRGYTGFGYFSQAQYQELYFE
jgi:hypothetical protein